MDIKKRISLSIYNIVLSVRDTLSLPTHNTLEKTLYYSAALLACSILSELIGFYTFISWQGALICVVALVALLWMERSENDALLKMYRTARVSAEKALRRAKAASSGISSKRSSTGNNRNTKDAGQRSNTRNKQQDK